MPRYYVNKDTGDNGEHEVHREGCAVLPKKADYVFLGNYMSTETAIVVAENFYENVHGCSFCSNKIYKN